MGKKRVFRLRGILAVCDDDEYRAAKAQGDDGVVTVHFGDADKLPKWWVREADDPRNRFPYDAFTYAACVGDLALVNN